MAASGSQREASAGRPTMCRSCGSIVGAGAKACGVCGAPAGSVPPPPDSSPPQMSRPGQTPPHDIETMRFARAVLTRPATFTFVFLAVNVFIFVLLTFSGAGGSENPAVLRAYGAKFNSLIDAGEWWRLVTPVFLHIGYLHLLVNMYSLFVLGPYVERLYGSAKFVCFWVATGIAGVAGSYFASRSGMNASGALGGFLFRGGDGPSAGASGALFGLIGVLFVFGIKFRHELPEGFKRAFGTGMIPTILINLFIGYSLPFIDNAAHLGGFAAGALLALCVSYKRPGESAGVAVFWHALQFIALALVVVSFGQVARHLDGVRPDFSDPRRMLAQANTSPVNAYVDAINEGQKAFHAALAERNAEAASRAIDKIDHTPSFAPPPDQFRAELKQLLVRAREFALTKADDRKGAETQQQLKQLVADFTAWEKRADGWVETEGKSYGIGLQKDEAPPPR